MDPIARLPEDGCVSDLVIGLVAGYAAGTLGMLATLYFGRVAGNVEKVKQVVESITANGIPAP